MIFSFFYSTVTTGNIGGVWYESIPYVKCTYFNSLSILVSEVVKHRTAKMIVK